MATEFDDDLKSCWLPLPLERFLGYPGRGGIK